MTQTEQRVSAALNRAVDRISPDLTQKILTADSLTDGGKPHSPKRIFLRFLPAAAAFAALLLAVSALVPRTGLAQNAGMASANVRTAAGHSAGSGVTGATCGALMHAYYLYRGNYYALGKAEPAIQKRIEKCLDSRTGLYQIRGESPAKSIALFINRYYWRLTYAFRETITVNGRSYALSANTGPDDQKVGQFLGRAGNFYAYRLACGSSTEKITVRRGGSKNEFTCFAYRLPASVVFRGKTYWLDLSYGIDTVPQGDTGAYLGKAGSYRVYRSGDFNPSRAVLLRVGPARAVEAYAVTPLPAGKSLPKSLYGSVFESMYGVDATVHWKGHGVYLLNDGSYYSDAKQKKLRSLAGKRLGGMGEGGHIFPIFSIKGKNPARAVLLQNHKVLIEYDFIYSDTLTFRGAVYVISDSQKIGGRRCVLGNSIGTADGFSVYSVKGVDPSKAILAQMGGSAGGGSMSTTELLIRKKS